MFKSCPASAGAAETANGAVERMVLLGLTGVYYIISAAMRLRCRRNAIPRANCRAEALARRDCRTTCCALPPRPPSSSLPSLPCADAQGQESSHLGNARKLLSKFTVADPFVHLLCQKYYTIQHCNCTYNKRHQKTHSSLN